MKTNPCSAAGLPGTAAIMYTLGADINTERGRDRSEETFSIRPELTAYGASLDRSTLGDQYFATHILRGWPAANRGRPGTSICRFRPLRSLPHF